MKLHYLFRLLLLLFLLSPYLLAKHKSEFRAFVSSRQSLIEQNAEINRLGIPRIEDEKELKELTQSGDLVYISKSKTLAVSKNLPDNRRYVKPWVYDFLIQLSQEYYEVFKKPLQVNSAIRPISVQRRLIRFNHNAAPIHGETASAHLTGIAVDLQRRGLSKAQKRFLQFRLLYYSSLDIVIVEEELRQPCFHIVVKFGP